MTHPNSVTNGSSLEDCHTNFFALADLCGIKWRRLTSETSGSVEPLEDPVLSSYCKCLAADLLCVWRRVKTSVEPNGVKFSDNQNNFTKELWVFWYGEDPDLTDLVHAELQETEFGSYETGLSYECRTLLFKALHNLIERCLLSRGFARLGRWFFQPTDTDLTEPAGKGSKRSGDGTQLTFAFNFFIHGDSTVCANVDVRQHPAVHRLTKADLQLAQTSPNGIRVVLGPYGMAGFLTGQSYKDTDPAVQKTLNEWRQCYPLPQTSTNRANSQASTQPTVNRVVEVLVAGFRMKYPFCYVFTTDIDEQQSKCLSNNTKTANAKSVANICEMLSNDSFCQSKPILCPYQQQIPTHTYLLKNCVSQELFISQQKAFDSSKISEEVAENLKLWSVVDPCVKNNCNCFRCKAKKGSASSKLANNHMSANKKGDKTDKESKNKVSKSVPPFHRRSPVLNSIDSSNVLSSSKATSGTSTSGATANQNASNSSTQPTSVPTYSYKSPISGGGLPSLQSSACTPSGANGVDSPHSVAQSLILDGPQSSVEQSNLPSVSPHPIKEEPITSESQSESLLTNPSPKDRTHLEQLLSPNVSVKASLSATNSPAVHSNQWTPTQPNDLDLINVQIPVPESKASSGNAVVSEGANQSLQTVVNGVKRPSLAISTYEDNENDMRNGLLYDYSHLNDLSDICDIPAPKNRRKNVLNEFRRIGVNDYYGKKKSPGAHLNGEFLDSQLMSKPKDPYEFSDFDDDGLGYKVVQNGVSDEMANETTVRLESGVPSLDTNGNNSSQTKDNQKVKSSELSATPPQLTKVFTNVSELVPSFSDLDQIFDTSSGEDSSDETFQPPSTPSGTTSRGPNSGNPSSNANVDPDHSKNTNTKSNGSAANIHASMAELARMFPTPPSLEPSAPSPCGNFLGADATIIDDMTGLYPCSPNIIENSKDWSYVYKPPVQSQVVASNKWSPLPNIPNLPSIPKECKYTHSVPTQPTPVTNNQNPMKSHSTQNQPKSSFNHYNHMTPLKQNTSNFMGHPMSRPPHPYSQIRMRANMSPVPMGQYQQMPTPGGIQHLQHMHGSHQAMHGYATQLDGPHVPQSPLPHYHPNFNPNSPASHGFYGNTSPYPSAHRSPHPATSPAPAMHFNPQSQANPYMARNALPQENTSSLPSSPEAHSLFVNLLLSDSMLNLFKDHNFESCSICVCNMNIKGSDVGVYLPEQLVPGGCDEQYRCTCGFSAVINRHRSQFAGLFYEDEVDITGVIYDPIDGLKKKSLAAIESTVSEDISKENKENTIDCDQSIIDLIITQTTNVLSSCSVLSKAFHYDVVKERLNGHSGYDSIVSDSKVTDKDSGISKLRNQSILSFRDGSQITFGALVSAKSDPIAGKHVVPQNNHPSDQSRNPLHEWAFKTTKSPVNNQEVIRLLRQLQPLMQESVQRKKTKMWEVTYTVSGPLTWRQFHRLAGRGTEDQCEPQPIPSLLVGYDKDCVALSPFALKYWDKLSLEPYSVTRDIAYIVVSPDNDYILSHVKTFFKELSTTYETLRLGKHCPIANVLRDGILRVGARTAKKLADEPIDEWFNQIGDGSVANKLKLYAQACRYQLSPHLSQQKLDKTLFESNISKQSNDSTNGLNGSGQTGVAGLSAGGCKPSNSPMPNSDANNDKSNDESHNEATGQHSNHSQQPNQREDDADEDPHKQPAIVIYIIEPFTFGSVDKDLYRLSSIGLLRCYTQIIRYLPENIKNSIHLQLISLDSLLNNGGDANASSRVDQLKELSLSVFSQCRQQLVHQSTVKSLTGFGPAAMFDLFLKSKDPASNISRIYTPPFILAPLKDKQTELGEMFGDRRERSQILFCCYCLTEDQRWLLASVTNDKGDLLETTSINIEIPNRTRRRKASVRRFGLSKLMRFVTAVMSESVTPWRLVIGRLGRLAHGELKDWASLLSKKSLLRYSRELREMCTQCSYLCPFDQPAIFSACLVSIEADTALRVFPDHYTPDERFSSSCNTCSLSTPEDATCTHILVFPTSATTQSSHGSFSIDPLGGLGANIGDDDMLLEALDGAVEDDINVNDIFTWTDSPPQSPSLGQGHGDGLSHPDSPGNRQGGFGGSGSLKTSNQFGVDMQDEPTQLLQQPLALAFYVSTAKTGPLPRWFWSSCPQMETSCPTFLKSALLIHTPSVQQNSDDLLHTNIHNLHPLDSNLTTDVLRCVLEGYNSLSWLSLDPSTHDRTSCLPIHIQLLMQLYHTVQALV